MDFYLDFNSDLLLAQDGQIQVAVGWDQVRQRILRRMITNAAVTLPTGVSTPADYIFHQDFGFGLGSLVGGAYTDDFLNDLQRRVAQAVFADDDIDATIPPSIDFSLPAPNTLQITIGVTLTSGQPGTISIQMTQ